MKTAQIQFASALLLLSCGGSPRTADDGDATGLESAGSDAEASSSAGDADDAPTARLDAAAAADLASTPPKSCKVIDGGINGSNCGDVAPPNSFEPDIQWSFLGSGLSRHSLINPLVANLTDDDGNGSIDLCDTPDVVLVTFGAYAPGAEGQLHVLDGATGQVHWTAPSSVRISGTSNAMPAIGDLDGDGVPEIVLYALSRELVALGADGSVKWRTGDNSVPISFMTGPIALADMDTDGDVEILIDQRIFDHQGALVATADLPPETRRPNVLGETPMAADMDGDGDLELLVGDAVFHHDGSVLGRGDSPHGGYPHVADLDGDGLPELLFTYANGMSLFEHDGARVFTDLRPTGDPTNNNGWFRPAAIHDIDGDGDAEILMSSGSHYSAMQGDGTLVWSADVADRSGVASGTAFDFLGDGTAEAIYGDENHSRVFDGMDGSVLMETVRTSRTAIEHPIVADIDNDGAAEILVTASDPWSGGGVEPGPSADFTLNAIRDANERWIPTRRIWNQYTYHVTNVLEDGTIPQFETPHWEVLNTFRTNAQIHRDGGVCMPPVEG